jgi:hypothetical protein
MYFVEGAFGASYTDDEYDCLMTVEGEMWAQFPDDYGYRITLEFEVAPVGERLHPLDGGIAYLRDREPDPAQQP